MFKPRKLDWFWLVSFFMSTIILYLLFLFLFFIFFFIKKRFSLRCLSNFMLLGTKGEGSMGGTEDLDIEVDVVETSEPEDLASSANRYHHHRQDTGTGKQNGSGSGPSKKKRCRETVSASSEEGDRTPPPHESSPTTSKSQSTMLAKCTSPDLASTECYLESVSKELWSKFHELGTEMIITKTGRYVIYTLKFPVFNSIILYLEVNRFAQNKKVLLLFSYQRIITHHWYHIVFTCRRMHILFSFIVIIHCNSSSRFHS